MVAYEGWARLKPLTLETKQLNVVSKKENWKPPSREKILGKPKLPRGLTVQPVNDQVFGHSMLSEEKSLMAQKANAKITRNLSCHYQCGKLEAVQL